MLFVFIFCSFFCFFFFFVFCFFFFFFKQKTAYEMLRSLVGSEMCIRDRGSAHGDRGPGRIGRRGDVREPGPRHGRHGRRPGGDDRRPARPGPCPVFGGASRRPSPRHGRRSSPPGRRPCRPWRGPGSRTSPRRPIRPGPRSPCALPLSLIHISEPTRLLSISYAVFCLKKKKKKQKTKKKKKIKKTKKTTNIKKTKQK